MEINAKKFILIMKVNFGHKVVDTPIGEGIVLDPFLAFIYSAITGAGYLDNPLYPFTVKGLTKLFYNAMDYKFVTGLFDNTTLKNTPCQLAKAKEYLFSSKKIIIPVEFSTELELQSKLKKLIKASTDPATNYIIQRIEISKKGNGMEPFMEYLTCEIVKEEGFIVENQIPLTHSTGSPDFGGYRLKDATLIIPNKIHLLELSLLRLGIEKGLKKEDRDWLLVGEAKTSTNEVKKQLDKYLKTGLFNEGLEINPSKLKAASSYTSLLTIGDDYRIKVIRKEENRDYVDPEKQSQYIEWLMNYVKYYLIANLTNDEFIAYYLKITKHPISSQEDVISFVNKLSYKEIIDTIKGVIENGTIK